MEINSKPLNAHTVVPFEVFEQVTQDFRLRLENLEQEVSFCRELLPGLTWMSRTQAMQFLCCCSTKLWTLKKEKKVITSNVGSKTLYKTESLRKYLLSQSIDFQEVNQRLKNIFT